MDMTFPERIARAKTLVYPLRMREMLDRITIEPETGALSMLGYHHHFDAVEFTLAPRRFHADGLGYQECPKTFWYEGVQYIIGHTAVFPLTQSAVALVAETRKHDYSTRTFFLVWDLRGELWVAKNAGETGQKLEDAASISAATVAP